MKDLPLGYHTDKILDNWVTPLTNDRAGEHNAIDALGVVRYAFDVQNSRV